MRTFSRADWNAAQDAWAEGGFSSEWRELRHTMAINGAIFPPAGDAFDSWEDDSPSQRAILIRAIRETPELVRRLSAGARSWSVLIDRLIGRRDVMREDAGDREDDARREKAEAREADRRAMRSVADVLATIANSGSPIR